MAETIYYSVITEIELLSASHLSAEDTGAIRGFLARCRRVELTPNVVEQTISIRRTTPIKTPDAIVAASALVTNVPLVTADKQFGRIEGLRILTDILD